jgi:hypothetical protein
VTNQQALGHLDRLYPRQEMKASRSRQLAVAGENDEPRKMYPGFSHLAE